MRKTNIFNWLLVGGLVFLAACGGGSDGSEENQAPVANAGADMVVNEQTVVTLEGVGTDVDGSIDRYQWDQLSGPAVSLSNSSVAQPSFTAPEVSTLESLLFELTVEDDQGKQSTDQVTIQVRPMTVRLTIQGKVTDGLIANATVTATIENSVFTAMSDQNGDYSIQIDLAEEFQESLVVLTASGNSSQAEVKLVSIPGVFSTLADLAGDDDILVRSENHLVDVTHMSTAVTGLLTIANANEFPQTVAEIEQAMPMLSGEEVLNAAVFVKLVVDHSATNAELSLPQGVTDTFALVSDFNSLVAYETAINTEVLQALFDEALTATLNDSNLYADSLILPLSYSWLAERGVISGDKLIFDISGTSGDYIHSRDSSSNQSTLIQGFDIAIANVTSLELAGAVVSTKLESLLVNGVFQPVTVETIHDKVELKLIASSANADLISYRLFTRKHYPNGELIDEVTDTTKVRTMAKTYSQLVESDLVGELMLPVSSSSLNTAEVISTSFGDVETTTSILGGVFSVFADGTVSAGISGLGDGNWSLDAGVLIIDFVDANLVVKKLRDTSVEVTVTDDLGDIIGFAVGEFALKNIAWTEDSVAGVYELSWEFSESLDRFWIELEADNSGVQVSTMDFDSNGQLDHNEYFETPVTWRFEDGKVIVERYRNLVDFCESLDPECYLYNRRTIDLFAIQGDKYFATNRHEFNFAPLDFGEIDPELTNLWTSDIFSTRFWIKLEQVPFDAPVGQFKTTSKLEYYERLLKE